MFGYTCVNDVTALDLIAADPSFAQWSRAKSFNTFGAFGPVIATGLDPDTLHVKTFVGGKLRQDYPVSDIDLLAPPAGQPDLARHDTCRRATSSRCGTSIGAMPMRPDVSIEIHIEGIGVLANSLGE